MYASPAFDPDPPEGPVAANGSAPAAPVLRAEAIRKRLGGNEVLRGVDLEVAKHEVVAIVGPSGAGKSTFLRCLNRLEQPDSGRVRIGDDDVTACPKRQLPALRARIGMVFQHFHLFPHLTARENVALAPRRTGRADRAEAAARADRLLGMVGLSARAAAYPRELSGGQQQRVAIARALAMEPELMLFDEPTSALDAETVHEVLGAMRQLSDAGMTMIVVSHEIGFVREAAHRVLFMDDGLVLESAPPDEFFTSPRHERARAFVSKIL